ncbi:MAG: divergent polysaccharide deacetylase family protein [Candidatus Cloacimonetes bacterium]|nr:divergent polysaccharide deacetylase family protein [Candidatus Cloacimonadota bacterium]
MEKKSLILLLIAFVLLFGCKAKPQAEQEMDVEPYPESSYTDNAGEAPADTTKVSKSTMAEISSYLYTWSKSDDLPPMVIVIDDFGQNAGELLQDFADLPSEIAFAILPDLPQTEVTAKLAKKSGHEVLIHIPMQAEGNANPGKRYIKTAMNASDISELIADFHRQIPNAIAANNHMGSAVTADNASMYAVMDKLNGEGLFFLDSATTAKSAVPAVASKLGLKTLKRDVFLDVPDITDATIISKIQSLSKYKGRNEPIIVITHCHNRAKLVGLQKFITQVTDMGIKLIPLSKAYRSAPPA